MTRVEITIEEVVLRGVPPEQAADVVAGLQRRLTELALADPDGLARLRPSEAVSVPHRGRPVQAGGAQALGEQSASAVWAAVSEGEPS